jgi:hypothetical protein
MMGHKRQARDAGYEGAPMGMGKKGYTFKVERTSSGNGLPQIELPPLPVPVGSPVWIMKPLMFR